MTARRWRDCGGFSLVEVLVALAVTGLVIAAGGALTATVQEVESRSEQANQARENVIAADRVLRAIVDGAAPNSRGVVGASEGWTGSQATMLTSGPPLVAFDRRRPMTLAIERKSGTARLLVRWRDPETSGDREEEILSGARALSLSYFARAQGRDAGRWLTVWPDVARLPDAVLLRIDMPALGPPLDLVARTHRWPPDDCASSGDDPMCRDDSPSDGSTR